MGPLEAIAVLTVGQHIIGPEFAAGYGFLLFLVVFQIFLSRRLALLRSKVAYATDSRVGLISQIISHPRTIKMKGWEWEFENRVIELRDREISNIMRTLKIKGFNEAISYFTSLVVSVLVFTLKVANGKVLTSKDVFTTLSLFNIVQLSLAKQIPNAIFLLSECYVSSKRLDAFFDLPEVKTKHPETSSITSVGHDCCDEGIMMIKNATCYWNDTKSTLIIPEKTIVRSSVPRWFTEEAKTPALLEISQNFTSNELYFVVGKTGSGKSAFLQLLAGELQPSSGISTRKASSVAYLPQNSFIMNCSIRENIIMDHPYDEDWFCDVIDACQLTLDLKTFSNGDLTVIGDRGVQCSGGQKTRIALARAIYHKESDILLLDDPLSAVDSKVAFEIYHSAILGLGLKRGKCVVLVTHQYQFCDGANVILLDKGSIGCNGTFGDCVKASGGMLSLKSRVSTMEKKLAYSSDNQETSSTKRSGDKSTFTSSVDESQKEERSKGTIELKTWKLYGKACGGYVMSFLFFLLFMVTQVSQLLATVQVGRWSSMSQSNQVRIIE
jgi:ATP-binding cassette subfamily C (CFTR/MRP) protein 4